MNFIEKINAAKNSAAAAGKQVNPLLNRTAPIVTATAPAEISEKPLSSVSAVTTLAKNNPFVKMASQEQNTVDSTLPKNPFVDSVNPFKAKENSATMQKIQSEATQEESSQNAPIVETVSTISENQSKTVSEEQSKTTVEKEPVSVLEKKTRRSGRTSKKNNNAKNKNDSDLAAVTDEPYDCDFTTMPSTTMPFADAAAVLNSPFADTAWTEFQEEIEKELNAIAIDQDMNPGVLKVVISELNIVYDKIAQPLHQSKTVLENLTNKDEGLINVIKSTRIGDGNNDMERKRAGFLAAMTYTSPNSAEDENINLFEMAAEARTRYNFLKSIYDRLKYKSDILITMNGALKLERDFVARSDN